MTFDQLKICNEVIFLLSKAGYDSMIQLFLEGVVLPLSRSGSAEFEELLEKRGEIALIWSVEDVLQERPDLRREQAMQVLRAVKEEHDANLGVSWLTIDIFASSLFPKPHDQEDGHDQAA